MNGGYVMANLPGFNTSMLPRTIPGLYNKIEAAVKTGKMVLIGGMTISGAPVSTFPTTINGPLTDNTEEALKYYGMSLINTYITVNENDYVAVLD